MAIDTGTPGAGGADRAPATVSPWLADPPGEGFPALDADLAADVAVIGGGIVGVATAQRLAEAGASVVLLEARSIGAGVTGNSTAKLTSLHSLVYAKLAKRHGPEVASVYADANQAGIEHVVGLAESLGVDCGLRGADAVTYTESAEGVDEIETEVRAAQAAGLPAAYTEQTDLPIAIRAAIRVPGQARFDPAAWCRGIAGHASAQGCRTFERTRVVDVDDARPCRVRTEGGHVVSADRVVLATQMPLLDRGLLFARLRPQRSYAVAAPPLDGTPDGMYIGIDEPVRSIRSAETSDGPLVILAGEGHKAGQGSPDESFARLVDDLPRFGGGVARYRWAAHDLMSDDGLPMTGPLAPWAQRLLIATGFSKWGLAAGAAASLILTDAVLERDNAWAETFDPRRLSPRSAPTLIKENADNAWRFFSDRLTKRGPLDEIEAGGGRVVGAGLSQRAVYRDDSGELHQLSARCTHLGCIVGWNGPERTWECPCHGSRFTATGEVLAGPASAPLKRLS